MEEKKEVPEVQTVLQDKEDEVFKIRPTEFKSKINVVGQIDLVQIDIDQESALADLYTIETVPTFILIRKGEQLWRQSGEMPLERLEKTVKDLKP